MGKLKDLMLDVEEQLANGATALEVSNYTGLPLADVLRIEAVGLGEFDSDEDYENHRRFQMIVDSLQNPPSFTGVENS